MASKNKRQVKRPSALVNQVEGKNDNGVDKGWQKIKLEAKKVKELRYCV